MVGRALIVGALILACGFLAPAPLSADIYVYRDANGVLHFTNAPAQSGYRRVIRETSGGDHVSPLSRGGYEDLIRAAADRYQVDADLVRAVIKAESDFNAGARSHKGAMGLMQLMPETARLHNVTNVFDPGDNIEGGVRHLRLLLGRFQGDLQLTLAAYNAGTGAVEKYAGIPPYAETREYVRRVLRYYQAYRGDGVNYIHEQVGH